MKKIFTLAAALLTVFTLSAETEVNPSSDISKDVAVAGTSYTIPSTFIAGKGSTKVSPMENNGVKVRINRPAGELTNALQFTVNEGYAINSIQIVGVTNSDDKAAVVGSIYVDGTAWNGTFDGNLPAKNAEAASNILVSGIEAKESVVFVFSELNDASQANICYTIAYEEATPSTDPKLEVNPTAITLAATAAKPLAEATVTFTGKNLTPGTYFAGFTGSGRSECMA